MAAIAGCGGGPSDGSGDGDGGDGGDGSGDGGDGGTELGDPVSINLLSLPPQDRPENNEMAVQTAEAWRELGIEVTVDSMNFPQFWETTHSWDYHAGMLGWTGSSYRVDPDHWCYLLFHSGEIEGGGYNMGKGYVDPEYDQLAERQREIYDVSGRQEVVYQCQTHQAEDLPELPVLAQEVINPWNSERFQNPKPMIGQGVMSFWNIMGIEPVGDVDTLRMGTSNALVAFNPLNTGATADRMHLRLIYDKLMRITREGVPEPWAAESVDQVDDTTFDVTLRDGMTFHDGEAVTAEDVKFSYEFQAEYANVASGFLNVLDTVEVTGDNQLQFSLSRPFAPFIVTGLSYPYILPKHIWEGVPDEVEAPMEYQDHGHIGSGPFVLDSWQREEEVQFSAFDDYFTQPNVDRYIYVPGALQAQLRLMENGQLDGIGTLATVLPDPFLRAAENNDHISLVRTPNIGIASIYINLRSKPLGNKTLRHALHAAIPKQQMSEDIFRGGAVPISSMINPGHETWHNADVTDVGDDVEGARQILEDSDFAWDGDGNLRYPPGYTAPEPPS